MFVAKTCVWRGAFSYGCSRVRCRPVMGRIQIPGVAAMNSRVAAAMNCVPAADRRATAFCVLLVIILSPAGRVDATDKVEETIQRIESLGGQVKRDEKMTGRPVTEIILEGNPEEYAPLLSQLRLFTNLTTLDCQTNITDAGLKELAGLKKLKSLCLANTDITDAGLSELRGIENLESLILSNTRVRDAGLKELSGLKNMKLLELGGTRITDAGLKALRGLKNLESLDLSGNDYGNITDAGLKELRGLKKLKTIKLSGNRITDAGLKELNGLKDLMELDLGATEITDVGLKQLAGLKKMTRLVLIGPRITDAGLKELSGLKN
ncbi:MAG TPA: hypothetical protein VEI07_03815, partial [Planctomycetaceae bacterium]|nr:hypothetical protein [Planctomycetaceae bacterium]